MGNNPAVSVVIPLYNTEKYIGACLDSILNQTFTDFEVIVVDDCSTDNSCAVINSYAKKFDGRLNLLHMEKNSGSAPAPRNKGLENSSGEYIFFMDADDMITKTALEEMYTLAKANTADVVYCEKNYDMNADGSNVRLYCRQRGAIDKPTFQADDSAERVKYLLQNNIWGTPWCKLVRRNLLIENGIIFPKVRPCDDHIWTLEIFFFAKKFLHVPNANYLWRKTESSATRGGQTPQTRMNLWINSTILGLKGLDKKLGELEFFQQNPQARYDILNQFNRSMFNISLKYRNNLKPFEIYEAIKEEFGAALGEQDVLIAMLCTLLDEYEKKSIERHNHIKILDAKIQELSVALSRSRAKVAELEAEINSLYSENRL